MGETWVSLAAWCGSGLLNGTLSLGLFAVGVAGGVTHCAPMCGGFVLGQVSDRMARLPSSHFCEWRRLQASALIPYHLGRLTTYATLGLSAGISGGLLGQIPYFSSALLLMGAILFLVLARRQSLSWLPGRGQGESGLGRWIVHMSPRDYRGSVLATYWLGVCLGLLPCGLVYSALAVATAVGNPWVGALGMATFGLGTTPALVIVGIAGGAAGARWRRFGTDMAPVALMANAALLTILAVRGMVVH